MSTWTRKSRLAACRLLALLPDPERRARMFEAVQGSGGDIATMAYALVDLMTPEERGIFEEAVSRECERRGLDPGAALEGSL